jgi:hypothetical protein
VPGGPRGLQNRRRRASGEVGSIPILSAVSFSIFDFAVAAAVSAATIKLQTSNIGEGGDSMSREQIRKLTSLSSCAG